MWNKLAGRRFVEPLFYKHTFTKRPCLRCFEVYCQLNFEALTVVIRQIQGSREVNASELVKSFSLLFPWVIFPALAFVVLRKDVGQKKWNGCMRYQGSKQQWIVQTFPSVKHRLGFGQQVHSHPASQGCHQFFALLSIVDIVDTLSRLLPCQECLRARFWLKAVVYPLRHQSSYARNAASNVWVNRQSVVANLNWGHLANLTADEVIYVVVRTGSEGWAVELSGLFSELDFKILIY